MGRRISVLPLLAALLYVALRLAAGAGERLLDTPYLGHGDTPATTVIPKGSSGKETALRLAAAGVVRDARALQWWLRLTGRAGFIHAGEYRFAEPYTVRQVAEILVQGRVAMQPVTIPEGATHWQVAETLAAAGFGSYEEALVATEQKELIASLDPQASNLEGYLFPDTYYAPHSASAAEVIGLMVERFRRAWTARRRAQAGRQGMGVREIVTIASLVETEAAQPFERPLVAAVYHNRLQRGMLLQCDPTLLYALRLSGRTDRNIQRADFAHDSPYNTYLYPGLPPGPIANPGEASLDAALSPAAVDYLYFVGRNDGSHAFSRTLREHNAMVNRFQRRLGRTRH
ncbi:MAG: endolytic transglycosylase MltG [Acidobacteriota bacterium]